MTTYASERLELAKQALVETGYFTADQVGDDIAPRIIELWAAAGRRAIIDQRPPVPNDQPAIADLVMADLAERKQIGIQRYGTPLQPHNGRDALIDAYQEAMDLTLYLRQAIEERPAAAVPGTRDRGQPYPTADAYEAACAALERHRQRADAAEAERNEAHNAVVETRRRATKAMTALRTKVLTALGREDDGRTLMTEYVDALAAEMDRVRAERDRLAETAHDLVEALRLTVEYVGTDVLKAAPGWSWYDALAKYAPDVAGRFAVPPVDTPCPVREDRRHCDHWRGGDGPCCDCGAKNWCGDDGERTAAAPTGTGDTP